MSQDTDARGARRENRSKSKERGGGVVAASAPLANEFLEDELADGSAQPSGNSGSSGAIISQDQSTIVPNQQTGIGTGLPGDLPPAPQAVAVVSSLDQLPPDQLAPSSRIQHAHPANVQAVPPNVPVQQLLQGEGVYHFDANAFQRFLEYERRQRELQQQFELRQLEHERQGRAPYERQCLQRQDWETLSAQQAFEHNSENIQPHNSEPPHTHRAPWVYHQRSASPGQDLPGDQAAVGHHENSPSRYVVNISSSSSSSAGSAERRTSRQDPTVRSDRPVITLHDTPQPSPSFYQQHEQRDGAHGGDSSDDVPLVQRNRNSSKGSDDSGASNRSKNRVSWQATQMGFAGIRCPMCGVVYQDMEEHNPFTCRHRNDGFTRTQAEKNWLADFSALTRAWKAQAPPAEQRPPLPNITLLEPAGGAAAPHTSRQRATKASDPRQKVRQDEQQARQAGVIQLGGNEQDRRDAREDAALESEHTSDNQVDSASSSSWIPTTSESSLSSYQQGRQEIKNMQQAMAEQTTLMQRQSAEMHAMMMRMQDQHHAALQQILQHQQGPMQVPVPMPIPPIFMPPFGFVPNGPMPTHMMFPNDASRFPPAHDRDLPFVSQPPHMQMYGPDGDFTHGGQQHQAPNSNERVRFQPAANHVENAGMAGAPELAPEQLGKVVEFQKHVKTYNAYAMKAVSKGVAELYCPGASNCVGVDTVATTGSSLLP